jgi:hypothetical protein
VYSSHTGNWAKTQLTAGHDLDNGLGGLPGILEIPTLGQDFTQAEQVDFCSGWRCNNNGGLLVHGGFSLSHFQY